MGFTKSTKSALSSSQSSLSQSQLSGYLQGEQASLDKKTPELEQRLELLELLVNEVNRRLEEHIRSQSRPAVLSRYRRILKKALGRFLPGSSIASQKTNDSVSANSDSDSQILYIMNWLKNQQAAGRTDRSLSQSPTEETLHMLHSSFLPQVPPLAPPFTNAHLTSGTFEVPNHESYLVSDYLNTSSLPELIGTSPLSELMTTSPLSELMTTSPISELMTADPMSELMDTEIGAMPGFRTSEERMLLLGASNLPDSPLLPTSLCISPISSPTTSGSPQAPSNIWSPASTHIPLSSLPAESPHDYAMHTRSTPYGRHPPSDNGFLAQVSSPEIHSTIDHTDGGLAQDSYNVSSYMGNSLSTPSRLTAYLPPLAPIRYSTAPSVMRHSDSFGTITLWPGHGSASFSPSEYRHTSPDWCSVGNQWAPNPNQFGGSIPSPVHGTLPIGNDETPTPMTYAIGESASGEVTEASSRYGCHHCEFYPTSGPDQRKKLRKHERTVKHLRIAGQGEVDSFPCGQCASTFNRRDNLRQHQKSCARRIRKVRRAGKERKKT
ncbi:hypothetical protein QBC40DRAFT_88146 [Triangularia verruculosa]|uniref:C2H2-type domain-containing protein n=1 Tax=Triangularia verruculosa TaxID=2587418 RepID=A0AAN6XEM3_9PEZI|nr:hypothetical protein QBC40DRAFT_88146 [Triangularia verruculosa]